MAVRADGDQLIGRYEHLSLGFLPAFGQVHPVWMVNLDLLLLPLAVLCFTPHISQQYPVLFRASALSGDLIQPRLSRERKVPGVVYLGRAFFFLVFFIVNSLQDFNDVGLDRLTDLVWGVLCHHARQIHCVHGVFGGDEHSNHTHD